MTGERIDFDALLGDPARKAEGRVIRSIMSAVGTRPVPRADLAGAIGVVGGPALAIAALLAVLVRVASPGGAPAREVQVTVGTALGISAQADRVIRGSQPATAQQLLAALEGEP